jgi:hypothetical protein
VAFSVAQAWVLVTHGYWESVVLQCRFPVSLSHESWGLSGSGDQLSVPT